MYHQHGQKYTLECSLFSDLLAKLLSAGSTSGHFDGVNDAALSISVSTLWECFHLTAVMVKSKQSVTTCLLYQMLSSISAFDVPMTLFVHVRSVDCPIVYVIHSPHISGIESSDLIRHSYAQTNFFALSRVAVWRAKKLFLVMSMF